jgi:hypothetical protein
MLRVSLGVLMLIESISDKFERQESKLRNMAKLVSLLQELFESKIPKDLQLNTKISSSDYKADTQNIPTNSGNYHLTNF